MTAQPILPPHCFGQSAFDPADKLSGSPVEGVMQPGFLDPAGVVRVVPGTRLMPMARAEVRVVFFSRVPVGLFSLN